MNKGFTPPKLGLFQFMLRGWGISFFVAEKRISWLKNEILDLRFCELFGKVG